MSPTPTTPPRPRSRLLLLVGLAGLAAAAALLAGLALGDRLADGEATTGPPPPPADAGSTPLTAPPATAPPGTAGPTSTTTLAPTTTTTATAAAPPEDADADGVLRSGEHGEAVVALQERLVELGYWLGSPDGTYGDLTSQAVQAFQKAEGLGRDGTAGPATLERLQTATRPTAERTDLDHLEIDLDRQLVLVVRGGVVEWVLNTSTGAAATPTRPGEFTIERRIDGMRHAPLGDLYRPAYFDGGIAVHGFPRVPATAASHGCARVSSPAMDMLWSSGAVDVGTTVVVR